MPNWKKVITSGSDAVLNEITSSGGILTSQNIMPDVDNTLSLGSSTQRFQLNGGTPVTVTGSGTENIITRFNGNTEVENSTIENTDTLTTIRHDNDTNDIFIVSGSNGELLKVTDEIGDQLLQVNDGSGITHFEVSSSGTLVAQNLEYTDETFVLTYNSSSGNISFFSSSAITGDDLGNHTATQDLNMSSNDIDNVSSIFASTFTGSLLRLDENGTGMRMTNVGAFENSSGFHIFSNGALRFSTNGSSNEALNIDTSQNAFFSAEVSSSDVKINDWGSVSSSLSTLNSNIAGIDSSVTLQDATDNGSTTTNSITVDSTIHVGRGGGSVSTNTAVGNNALGSNSTGNNNTALGKDSLSSSTDAHQNVAFGVGALRDLTLSGTAANTAIGYQALRDSTGTSGAVAVGNQSAAGASGDYFTAVGYQSLLSATGDENTALGYRALKDATSADQNTAVGTRALQDLTTGDNNTAIGKDAGLLKGNGGSNLTSANGVFLGYNTKPATQTSSNEIVIGYNAVGNGSNTVTIGNSSITNNYFSGDIDADDITINDWGSVSASLATLDASTYGDSDVTDHINSLDVVSGSIIHPTQLYVDCKAASSGYIPWYAIVDIQQNPSRAFSTWIAPSSGYIEKVIVSPEQGNSTTANGDLTMYNGGSSQGSTVTVAMGAAGVHKTFNFGESSYSFNAGDRVGIHWDKNTNTADLYGMMVVFRLDN